MKKVLILFTLFIFVNACDFLGNNIGPCVHINEEPVLTIESVTDGTTGDEITEVIVFDVFLDNDERGPDFLTAEVSDNISVEDSVMVCTVPCGFGNEGGLYRFNLSAESYQNSLVTIQANYATSEGGCPSRSTDGTRTGFSLVSE